MQGRSDAAHCQHSTTGAIQEPPAEAYLGPAGDAPEPIDREAIAEDFGQSGDLVSLSILYALLICIC